MWAVQSGKTMVARRGASAVCCRNFSDDLKTKLKPQGIFSPAVLEQRIGTVGHGGRSSDRGMKIAVFGGSGFLGQYVANELGSNGFMAYFANRGDDMEMRHLKIPFDLGRCKFVFYSPRDEDSIREVIADADVVVNMIGKYYESAHPYQTDSFPYVSYKKNYTFEETQVTIPRKLAEICLDMQVDYFIHVSSASARPDAKSEWSRTKFAGEEAVKKVYPWATIVRPTQMYGRCDRLLTDMARMQRYYQSIILAEKTLGQQDTAVTQPVWVADVARAIVTVCDNPEPFVGKRIDCFGPKDYTYHELAKFVDDCTLRRKPVWTVPSPYLEMFATVAQYQRNPFFTPDLVKVWSEDFLPPLGSPEAYDQQMEVITLKDMGIQAEAIEKIMYEWLQVFRYGGHFHYVDGYH